MKRIISVFLCVAMLMSMVVISASAWDEDVASQITTENKVSYTLNKDTYEAGDEVLITVKMDEIWGDPDLVGSIPGFAFEAEGAYGMSMLNPSIAFPSDVFEVTKSIRDYAGSSKIYGYGKDPNGDKWGNTMTMTDSADANAYGFLAALIEAKDIYVYEYENDDGDYEEAKIFGLFQGKGNLVQFRMNVKEDAKPGTYKIPLGSFQRADGADDAEYEFFGNYFKYNGFVDGAANAYGERPISFKSATNEYVNNDPSQGAYITIVIEGDVNTAALEVDELIAAIGEVTLDSEAAITAARTAYDNLSDADKAAVTGLAILEAAEETLEILKLLAEAEEEARAAAAEVDALIDAIGSDIQAAGDAYFVNGISITGFDLYKHFSAVSGSKFNISFKMMPGKNGDGFGYFGGTTDANNGSHNIFWNQSAKKFQIAKVSSWMDAREVTEVLAESAVLDLPAKQWTDVEYIYDG
ncbi:MAG: hypothetical protein IKU19_09110, partial [Clostridia bacterium]|nr:hypothetical protein [Clostridia bacterium]